MSVDVVVGPRPLLQAATSRPHGAGQSRDQTKHLDESGDNVVEIDTWVTNQRGQNVVPGTATVVPPRRS